MSYPEFVLTSVELELHCISFPEPTGALTPFRPQAKAFLGVTVAAKVRASFKNLQPARYNGRLMLNLAKHTGLGREAVINSARTAVAAVVSMLLARSLKLPEFYWAPISTIVILLSTINPMTLAWQRFAGTAWEQGGWPILPRFWEGWKFHFGLTCLSKGGWHESIHQHAC